MFAANTGYLEWAASNDLIVLFPMIAEMEGHPYAQWDWTGVTGANFNTKSGIYPSAIMKMVDKLVAPRPPIWNYKNKFNELISGQPEPEKLILEITNHFFQESVQFAILSYQQNL